MNNEIDTTNKRQTTNGKQTICIALFKYILKRSFVFGVVWWWCGVRSSVWCGVSLPPERVGCIFLHLYRSRNGKTLFITMAY